MSLARNVKMITKLYIGLNLYIKSMDLKTLREKALSDCAPEKAFWTCNSTVCRNIYELAEMIKALNDWGFKYHVNIDNSKNDFADWIEKVLKDEKLALSLTGILDKDRYVDIIKQRIKELEQADGQADDHKE